LTKSSHIFKLTYEDVSHQSGDLQRPESIHVLADGTLVFPHRGRDIGPIATDWAVAAPDLSGIALRPIHPFHPY